MKTLLISTALALSVTSANAWGEREQGALIGLIVGGLIVSKQEKDQPRLQLPQPQQVIILPPVYIPPKTQTCLQHPVYDQYGRLVAYQLSCH
jgi:hypothetical protein